MPTVNLSTNESLATAEALKKHLGLKLKSGDEDQTELRFGSITLILCALAKIVKTTTGCELAETDWGKEVIAGVVEIRRQQGLPDVPTRAERKRWASVLG